MYRQLLEQDKHQWTWYYLSKDIWSVLWHFTVLVLIDLHISCPQGQPQWQIYNWSKPSQQFAWKLPSTTSLCARCIRAARWASYFKSPHVCWKREAHWIHSCMTPRLWAPAWALAHAPKCLLVPGPPKKEQWLFLNCPTSVRQQFGYLCFANLCINLAVHGFTLLLKSLHHPLSQNASQLSHCQNCLQHLAGAEIFSEVIL